MSDYDKLLRRGQLYIGEHIPERFSTWKRVPLDDSLWLATHPAVNVARAVRGSFVLTAVGFLIDPEHPERTDAEIVEDLLATPGFTTSPFEPTHRLGGRWLLVLAGPEDTLAFGDPGGLRQVYLAPSGDGGRVHFASEPGLLGELGGLEPDPDAESFRRSPGFINNGENWWPGDASPFREVRRLLPNHAVSLRTGQRTRFWPSAKGARASAEEAIDLLVRSLPAMLKGLASRRDVTVSLTAGLDSRMVLAGTREMAGALRYLTIRQAGMRPDHADLEIAGRLADRLGLEHRVVVSAESVREPVRAAFRDGVLTYHEKWLQDAQAIFDAGGQEVAVVTGSMGEALRLTYDKAGIHRRHGVSAAKLARVAKLGAHPFALRHFEAWLDSLDRSRITNVGDIYYLEQRSARWLASSQLEFGQVWGEVFAPLNSREIIGTLQGAPRRARRGPKSILFREVIRRLWPEALLEPINPHVEAPPKFRLPRFARGLQRRVRRLLG